MDWNTDNRADNDRLFPTAARTCAHYQDPHGHAVEIALDRAARVILYGSGDEKIPVHYQNRTGDQRIYATAFEGIINNLRRRYREILQRLHPQQDRGLHGASVPAPPARASASSPPCWP